MFPNTNLRHALEYAELGWHVFPVNKDKKPLTVNGFKDATVDQNAIRAFWANHPEANIGVATGSISGIIVLDVDPSENNVEEVLWELVKLKGSFPQSVAAKSGGGGYHFYFRHPQKHVPSTTKLFGLVGIDIRSDGGYIIVPPSKHLSGNNYVWGDHQDPFETSLDNCPSFIIDAQLSSKNGYLHTIEPILEGNRNSVLTSIAGLCRSLGLDEQTILIILKKQNDLRCVPPLKSTEIGVIAKHISDYPPFKTNGVVTASLVDDILLSFPHTDAGFAELLSRMFLGSIKYNHTNGGWYLWRGQFWQIDHTKEIYQKAIYGSKELYRAANSIEDLNVRQATAKHAIKSQNLQRIAAALGLLQSYPTIATVHEQWDAQKDIVACLNGTISLETGKLEDSEADNLLAHYIPHEYNPSAKCPRWLQFINEVFVGDQKVINFVQRAVGYSLTGKTDEQCIFLMIGKGSNGKSTFLELLHALFGNYAVSAPFSTFERNRNNTQTNDIALLAGKRLVFSSEPNQGVIFDESRIKSLTGGDSISARFLHKEFFEFSPICKIWMGVNHLPRVKDDSDGFWRRVRRIDFPVRFYEKSADIPKGAKLQDPSLLPTLIQEIPGIFNWVVEGAIQWFANGLEIPASIASATQEYRDDSDPLYNFFQTCCILDSDKEADVDTLYRAYSVDCENRSLRKYEILSTTRFQERLKASFERSTVNGRAGVSGICLNEEGLKLIKSGGPRITLQINQSDTKKKSNIRPS